MGVAHLFEDFGTLARTTAPATDDGDSTLDGLDMFEKGYKDGWDDALKAQAQSRDHLAEELSRSLQDLSFTYHEAHAHMVKALAPMLEQMVGGFLPDLARAALLPRIAEELAAIGRQSTEITVELAVHPANLEALREMVTGAATFPVEVTADPALTDMQANLRFGTAERQIDYDTMLGKVMDSVRAFFEENRKDMNHD